LNPKDSQSLPQMGVCGVKNLNTCVLDFCDVSVLWSV